MSKSFRFFIIVGVFSIVGYCLYPTIQYYFFVDENLRKLSELSLVKRDVTVYEQEELDAAVAVDKIREKAIGLGLDIKGGVSIILEADFNQMALSTGKNLEDITEQQKIEALERVIFKIQNRIDEFGVSEVSFRKVGDNRISLQIPGETSFDRIENIIETAGNLALRLASEEGQKLLDVDLDTKEIKNLAAIEENYYISYLYVKNNLGFLEKTQPVVLEKEIALLGERIRDASTSYGQYGELVVTFELDSKGAHQFSDITGNNRGRQLAIVLDDKVVSMPRINDRIPSGRGQIDGQFTPDEAKDLSLILRSGSLPVPVKIIARDIIGPKIGNEILRKSLWAMAFALLGIFILMIIRYRFSGLVASLTLILNGVVILSLLAPFSLKLSIPGIAGLILTIGMAIDANVLIYERIREEITAGKLIDEAFQNGYVKAFWSIFDANITTIIAAFILSSYGEGAIKGFATTLFIGIIVSMFTALFLTRFLFDVLFHWKRSIKYSRFYI